MFRYIHEALDVLAALAPSLTQAMAVAARKAFVILDGTLLAIDRVGTAWGQVVIDPTTPVSTSGTG